MFEELGVFKSLDDLSSKVRLLIYTNAKEIVESGEEHVPMIFLIDKDLHLDMFSFEFTEEIKSVFSSFFRKVLIKNNAIAYFMINEAWVSCGVDDKSQKFRELAKGNIKVSELPLDDRKEQLIVLYVVNGQKAECSFADIKTVLGQRSLGEWKTSNESLVGRLIVKDW